MNRTVQYGKQTEVPTEQEVGLGAFWIQLWRTSRKPKSDFSASSY